MKNRSIFSAVAIAALSIVSCQKETSPVAETSGKVIELNATIEQTKTTFDPSTFKVSWVDGDQITATGEDWTATFTYDASKEAFVTTDMIPEGPQTDVTFQYGETVAAVQNMDCDDPLAHIAPVDKLTGTASFDLSENPAIDVTLAHVNALMSVSVKNGTAAPLTITQLLFKVVNTALSTGGRTITLNVSNCAPIAVGASYTLYFLKSPIASANYNITLTVVDDSGVEYSKSINRDWEIVAGTYNPTPYTVKAAKVTKTLTFHMSEIAGLVADKDAIANGSYSLTADEDGKKYPFSLYQGSEKAPSYSSYLVLNIGNYLGTPAIEGAALKTFTFTQSASTKTRKSAMTTSTHDGALNTSYYDASVEADGASINTGTVNTDYTYTIKSTVKQSNKSYYLVCGSAGIGVSKVVLVYERD